MTKKDTGPPQVSPPPARRPVTLPNISNNTDSRRLSSIEFAKRAAIVAGVAVLVVALAGFFWTVGRAFLVLFAAILLAVMLDGLTRLIARPTRLPRSLSLIIVIVGLTALMVGIFIFGGVRVAAQAPALQRNIEQSINRIERRLHEMGVNPSTLSLDSTSSSNNNDALPSLSKLFSYINGYLSTSLELVINLLIILATGIYFAASPRFYIEAPIMLVPRHRRERLYEISREVGHALRRWLVGRFAAMLLVGLLTGIGLTLLNVKLAVLLAAIACLLTFIPYLGTIISVIPAVLLGFLNNPMTAAYVVLLYLVAHALEAYILSPLIQSQTIHLAPGWLILSQLVGGLAAGIFGILLAAPLFVTLTILVQMLYVEDVLGDRVRILGE